MKIKQAPAGVEYWPVDRIVPSARNAKAHDVRAVHEAADSLQEYGWTYPLLIDEAGGLLAGHRRLAAAKLLGMTEVPVLVKTGLTEEQKRAYRLADNKLAERTDWDLDILKLELDDLQAAGIDLKITGFDEADLVEIGNAVAVTRLGTPPSGTRCPDRIGAIKIVLFVEELIDFEEALRLTGKANRAEAMLTVCRHYLMDKNEKRQFDLHVQNLPALAAT